MYKLNNEPYRLQINDILFIDIKAENPEFVAMFNTSGTNGGGNGYFSGYTVNRHGNVRIPYIGDLNVLGYTEREIREKIEIHEKRNRVIEKQKQKAPAFRRLKTKKDGPSGGIFMGGGFN